MTDAEVRAAIELGIDNYAAAQFAYMTGRDADPKFREQAREQAIALIEAYGAWREAEGAVGRVDGRKTLLALLPYGEPAKRVRAIHGKQVCCGEAVGFVPLGIIAEHLVRAEKEAAEAEAERDRRADALAQLIGG